MVSNGDVKQAKMHCFKKFLASILGSEQGNSRLGELAKEMGAMTQHSRDDQLDDFHDWPPKGLCRYVTSSPRLSAAVHPRAVAAGSTAPTLVV